MLGREDHALLSATTLTRVLAACFASLLLIFTVAAYAQGPSDDALRIYAAGSLRSAFEDMLPAFRAESNISPQATCGPAGMLRQRIEGGEHADVFASADLGQPQRLAASNRYLPVVLFARSAMCMLGRSTLRLTETNLLDQMVDPKVRLMTGTPKVDPGGDYALAVFDRAEQLHPGVGSALRAKAKRLAGAGPHLPGKDAIASMFLSGRADIVLGYCYSAEAERRATSGLVVIHLPPALAVTPEYGITVRSDVPGAMRFALFVMSERGQTILKAHHFAPVAVSAGR